MFSFLKTEFDISQLQAPGNPVHSVTKMETVRADSNQIN